MITLTYFVGYFEEVPFIKKIIQKKASVRNLQQTFSESYVKWTGAFSFEHYLRNLLNFLYKCNYVCYFSFCHVEYYKTSTAITDFTTIQF